MRDAAIVWEASRDGYSIDQVYKGAMTVGRLRSILNDFSDDTPVILSHDKGYTYGSIYGYPDFQYFDTDEDEDEEE